MTLGKMALAAVVLFPLSEIALALSKRARRDQATPRDRGSLGGLWIAISVAVAAAILCSGFQTARLPIPPDVRLGLAIGLILAGLAFRWWAILTLGRFFTVDVAAHHDHRLVDAGPYRLVLHPSYTGLLIAFLGLGVFFGNVLSVAVLMVSVTTAFLLRIRVEEVVLAERLGADYTAYQARTKRLIPGVY